ncbi:MAG: DNA-binding protein AraC-type [Paenibacillus sp.]|nr:DNA-binding protein AraC-type [Paenibacillus sp.]
MQPIRKPFMLDPIFPFDLVYQGIRYSENELPDHLHDLYELVYIHRGTGKFFIDHTIYEKGPGDLFLIPGNTVHRAFPLGDQPIVSTAVFFAPSLMRSDPLGDGYKPLGTFELARKRKQYRITLEEPARGQLEACLLAMAEELGNRAAGYRHALWLRLQQLLLELSWQPFSQAEPSTPSAGGYGPPWIRKALSDMNRDPVGCGGLAELAGRASVSASHFSRVFKELTGMNVTDYINAKRLVLAKNLLLETDDNIETIALACGYQGMRHFYQQFKKLTGLTPKAYRDQTDV